MACCVVRTDTEARAAGIALGAAWMPAWNRGRRWWTGHRTWWWNGGSRSSTGRGLGSSPPGSGTARSPLITPAAARPDVGPIERVNITTRVCDRALADLPSLPMTRSRCAVRQGPRVVRVLRDIAAQASQRHELVVAVVRTPRRWVIMQISRRAAAVGAAVLTGLASLGA